MLEDGHCLRDQAMGFCFEAGADEDTHFRATSTETLRNMVAAGSGSLYCLRWLCRRNANAMGLFICRALSRNHAALLAGLSSRLTAAQPL